MSSNEEYCPTIYTLEDEEGEELQFELLDSVELDDNVYYAMIPYHENIGEACNDDGALVVFKAEIVEGEEMLRTIDDEDEYQKIGQFMFERVTKMFEYEEDDYENED